MKITADFDKLWRFELEKISIDVKFIVTFKNFSMSLKIFGFLVSKIKISKGISGLMKNSSVTCEIIEGIKFILLALMLKISKNKIIKKNFMLQIKILSKMKNEKFSWIFQKSLLEILKLEIFLTKKKF